MGVKEDFNNGNKDDDEYNFDGDEVPLPGFRFHPTDEELVGFYLRRKLDKKPISLELIKQIDIYKYDPWDLPKASSTGGEKEWYFFCQRGRKYRNSIRPNRVTGSGFWKATGIDKSVYSVEGKCIGLKKTLVYYRGSAGKGTKTDWMMHEFRLPSSTSNNNSNNDTNTKLANAKNNKDIAQEAEVWTLCRIIKRVVSQKKYTPECRSQLATKRKYSTEKITTRTSSMDEYCNTNNGSEAYINFGTSLGHYYDHNEQKPVINYYTSNSDQRHHQFHVDHHQLSSQGAQHPQLTSPSSNFWINAASNDFFAFDDCDELGSVVKFALDSSIM